ncbi:hypothetical protein LZ30DRAFT_710272 [Colletotrichum cereale]|nr:hypothetical protein LZ30DRAFT_710272 [Colletotrichum cereale]
MQHVVHVLNMSCSYPAAPIQPGKRPTTRQSPFSHSSHERAPLGRKISCDWPPFRDHSLHHSHDSQPPWTHHPCAPRRGRQVGGGGPYLA